MLFGSGSEGHGNLMEKTATENGTYTAAEEIDPETGEVFDPPKDGYSVFTVDLALDDKSVSFTTSQITGSQTAEFEYDPHDENPELEGYSLFTIDLSAVKTDIEDMQAQIASLEDEIDGLEDEVEGLEDELEQCHDCKDEVIAEIRKFVPDYEVGEDGCPKDGVPKVYQAAIDEVIGGEDDDEAQEKINGEPPEGPDPTPENPQKIFKIENGKIAKKISWWWTDDWYPGSEFRWWLLFRHFTVSITTYDEDYNPTTVSQSYQVGWVYDSSWETEPDYGPDWRPTTKQALDSANWTMQYFNDNTDPNDPIFHVEWDNRSGWPGVTGQHWTVEY